jgi:hypothetical protein
MWAVGDRLNRFVVCSNQKADVISTEDIIFKMRPHNL